MIPLVTDRSTLVALCVLLASLTSAQDAGVALFENRGYRGEHFFITQDWSAGDFDPWANRIESVQVPDGWEVWLYEQRNFKGPTLKLTGSWDGMDSEAWMWRDDIRSVRIVRRPAPLAVLGRESGYVEDRVVLFSDRNHSGEQLFLEADWSAGNMDPWANRIESVRVPEGWEVWLYEQREFKGRVLKLTGSWDGMDSEAWKWRDDIRSLRIVRRPLPPVHHHQPDGVRERGPYR